MKPIDQLTPRQQNGLFIRKLLKTYPGYTIMPPLGDLMATMDTKDLIRIAKRRLVKKPKKSKVIDQGYYKANYEYNVTNLRALLQANPGKKLAFYNEGSLTKESWRNLEPIFKASLVDA
jgi:hypothetical protein